MNPLIRYTIGKVGKAGWDILSESIRLMKKVYPEFDIVICHNKLSEGEINRLLTFGVSLLKQDDLPKPFRFLDNDEGKIRNFCWKLVPPRIRPEAHELWVDNDVIFTGRIKGIDNWLAKATSVISTGFNHDYGRFRERLLEKEAYCAGLFGLPPHFDFSEEIGKLSQGMTLKGFDEQGLVALIVTSFYGYISLPQTEVVLLSESWAPKGVRWFPNGLHFARANRFDNHTTWRLYKLTVVP